MVKEFHETTGLRWCKLHRDWWSSPSHVGLNIVALGIGACLMQFANERGRMPDGSGRIVDGAGEALSLSAMARVTHASEAQASEAIEALIEVGTLARRDGCVVFVNLQKWQENPSAARMRKYRQRRAEAQAKAKAPEVAPSTRVPNDAQATETAPGPVPAPLAARPAQPVLPPETFTLGLSPPAPKAKRKPLGQKPKKDKKDLAAWFLEKADVEGWTDQIDRVCEAYNREYKRVFPRSRPNPSQLDRGTAAQRLHEGRSLKDIHEAVLGCLRSQTHVEGGHTSLELICRETKFENFRKRYDAAQNSPTGTVGSQRARLDPVRVDYAEQLRMRNAQMARENEARSPPDWGGPGAIDVGQQGRLPAGRGRAA